MRAVIYEAVPASLAEQGVAGLREVLTGLHRIADLPASDAEVERAITAAPAAAPAPTHLRRGGVDTAGREAELVAYTTRASNQLTSPDPGAMLMRTLTDEARLSLLVRTHPDVLARLLTGLGRARTRMLLTEFLTESPASLWTEEQGDAFAEWLARRADLEAALTA